MESETIVLAKILGPLYILTGLVFMGRPKLVKKMVKEFTKEEEELFQWGMVSFVVGVVILQFHFLWNTLPEILISTIGVLAIFKGIFYVFLPRVIGRITQKFNDIFIIFGSMFALILGIYFFQIIYA